LKNFQSIIAGAPDLPQGFIGEFILHPSTTRSYTCSNLVILYAVLAHDLYPQSVALAVEFVLPAAIAAGNLTIEPIITCLGKPLSEGYIETASGGNASSSPTSRRETSQSSVGASSKAANAAKPSISIGSQNTRDLFIFVSAAALAIINVY
jgi:hypothetical protein